MNKYRYAIYENERTVFCYMLVHKENDYPDVFCGKATCHRDDRFDVEKGMKIAQMRCEESYIKNKLNYNRHMVTKLNKKSKLALQQADDFKKDVDCLKEELFHLQKTMQNLMENS